MVVPYRAALLKTPPHVKGNSVALKKIRIHNLKSAAVNIQIKICYSAINLFSIQRVEFLTMTVWIKYPVVFVVFVGYRICNNLDVVRP